MCFIEALGTTWTKYYCEYYKSGKKLKLTQYNPSKPVRLSVVSEDKICKEVSAIKHI